MRTDEDLSGEIIRIIPWELSVRDGSFYSTLYVAGAVRRTQIFPRYMAGIAIDGILHSRDSTSIRSSY